MLKCAKVNSVLGMMTKECKTNSQRRRRDDDSAESFVECIASVLRQCNSDGINCG